MSEFEAEQNPDGTFDIREDGRVIHWDADDLDDALYVVRARRGRSVTVIDLDGYRHRERV